jgi:hypothetical protein
MLLWANCHGRVYCYACLVQGDCDWMHTDQRWLHQCVNLCDPIVRLYLSSCECLLLLPDFHPRPYYQASLALDPQPLTRSRRRRCREPHPTTIITSPAFLIRNSASTTGHPLFDRREQGKELGLKGEQVRTILRCLERKDRRGCEAILRVDSFNT